MKSFLFGSHGHPVLILHLNTDRHVCVLFHLDEVSGLHSNRSPLPHAVREPGDVQHVHVGEIVQGALLQPLPQGRSLVVL